MKNKFLLIIIGLNLFFGCGKKSKDSQAANLINVVEARNLGLAYLEENQLDKAEEEFLKVVNKVPDDAMGYANLGIIYMRKGQYDKAEEQLNDAINIDSENPDIKLILAEVFEAAGENKKAIEVLQQSLDLYPNHIRSLYRISELFNMVSYSNDIDISTDGKEKGKYLFELVKGRPSSTPARLQLIESLLEEQLTDSALAHMEEIIQQIPEPPKEAKQAIRDAIKAMQTDNNSEATRSFKIVHNVLKVTARYQGDLIQLRGPGGSLAGFPILDFSENLSQRLEDESTVLTTLLFTDATELSGLEKINKEVFSGKTSMMNVGDFDGDKIQDIYFSSIVNGENKIFILRQEFGEFLDVTSNTKIGHEGVDLDANFSDIDNDGHLDLLISNSEGIIFYNNNGEGSFRNISEESNFLFKDKVFNIASADFDHDGDLDIYALGENSNFFWRNNLDGTFSEMSQEMKIVGDRANIKDGAYGDFDEDGDLDFITVTGNSPSYLLSNLRQGEFEQLNNIGIGINGKSIITGDYNNDGFLDLFIIDINNEGKLYNNLGENLFKETLLSLPKTIQDSKFLDFDNDGYLDIVTVGKEGIHLYHNAGENIFEDMSYLLPQDEFRGNAVEIMDYNLDGDLDIIATSESGKIKLLRNDGGNLNKYLKVRLVGLRAGSGKNNHFGIGAKVEIRAGDLYQSRIVTSEVTHFGIGQNLKADVMRIVWTNGAPQNMFFPGSDQDIVEEQILKGSCPFLYAWNGEKFEFVKDVLWRSALGMPLGIMAGEMAYAFPNSTEEYFKIPGDAVKPKNGEYLFNLTMELWETNYLDNIKLHVIDHPVSAEIYVDEKFLIPPYPPRKIYSVSEKLLPLSAIDGEGNNMLPALSNWDYKFVSNFLMTDFQGIVEPHDLILDLGELKPSDEVTLFLHGWIFPTDASINVNRSQSSEGGAFPPGIQVINESGEWETVIQSINFPNGKDKTCIVDLTGKFLSNDYRIRLQTSMQIYWDHAFFTLNEPEVPIKETILLPSSADLHYRGHSSLFRKGGRYGPHWPNYNEITTGPKWRDLTGMYTRYGDVTDLLQETDNQYLIMNSGDELSLNFSESQIPDLKKGWTRDYLFYNDGWLKDGDLNTAKGKTVMPLPFKGLTVYPYDKATESTYDSLALVNLKKYNTRQVNGSLFRDAMLEPED